MLDVSIVVPTYREAENLKVLIPRLADAFAREAWTWEVVVVDDASNDDTPAVCARLAQNHPLRLIVRRNERGLSSAVIRGMSEARGQVLLCMDADLSHPPEIAPELARRFLEESPSNEPDFVIGSRYVAGGSTEEGWGLFRWLNSKVATWLARPLVRAGDPMAGFFALRRSDFMSHRAELNPVGYKIGLELMVKCGCRNIMEIPIQFANRLHGESKLCLREQWNYLRHLARLYEHRYRELSCLVRFGLVGLSGVAVDLLTLALLLSLGMSHPLAAAFAIWLAMTWNFAGNRWWTFQAARTPLWTQYLKFCSSCLLGGALNWSTRVALTTWVAAFAERPFAAAGLGVLAGFAFNYVLCRYFVFRHRGERVAAAPAQSTADATPVDGSEAERDVGSPAVPVTAPLLQRTLLCGLLTWLIGLGVCSGADAPPVAREAVHSRTTDAQPPAPVRLAAAQRMSLDLSDQAIEQRLRNDVTWLASDELEGRGVRTKGLHLASEFLAREFAAAGLHTAHYNGTAFHEFRLHAAGDKGAVQELAITLPDGEQQVLSLGSDYLSLMVSPKASFRVPMVFVGFGITDPERGYDDYEGLNVAGKAVVVLRHEPLRPGDEVTTGGAPRKPALVMTKIRNAIAHGAAAVILVTDFRELAKQLPPDVPEDGPIPETPETLLDVEFNTTVGGETLPVVHCQRRIVETWIRTVSEKNLAQIEAQIEHTQQPASFELLGCTMTARVAVSRAGWTLRNVVGSLPGTGPLAAEALVIGAHYDHLGRGGWGSLAVGEHDVVHNGADDNASGTAVLLEVARQMAASPTPRNRQLVFVAFSAEELGLIGSRRYVQNPLVPLDKTVAMLNLDMVGRLRNDRLMVYGTGTAVEWPTWLADSASPHHVLIIPRPSGYGPSDHASFYERGIPVLHFFTGFHPEYHRPSDDAELLNIAGMRRITGLLVDLIRRIDASPTRPRMTSVDESSILASLGEVGFGSIGSHDSGPRLGVILDTDVPAEGVRIKQLLKYGPAERGGLRSGDVILKLDDQPMKSVEDVQKYVESRQRGQSVTVEFDRRGTRRQVDLTL